MVTTDTLNIFFNSGVQIERLQNKVAYKGMVYTINPVCRREAQHIVVKFVMETNHNVIVITITV